MSGASQVALIQIPLLAKINQYIINPFIVFFVAFALAGFIMGIVYMVLASGGDAEKLASGKRHLLWGIVGLFIMVSVFGLINLVIDFLQGF